MMRAASTSSASLRMVSSTIVTSNALSSSLGLPVGGVSGVVTKVFDRYGIIHDGLQREFFFRLDDANNVGAVVDGDVSLNRVPLKSSGPEWNVGMPVTFTPRERPNQPYDRRFVAEGVRFDVSSAQTKIVSDVLARMEDDQWLKVLADVEALDATRGGPSVATFPTGYDVRYLVFEEDLKAPLMGTRSKRQTSSSHNQSDGLLAGADDEELLSSASAMEAHRREADEIDFLNIAAYR